MRLKIYHVDAFADSLFKGNPACVVPLEYWPSDDLLLRIAKENALPETAFFIINKDFIQLRWFTPDLEMDLCGHATLAAAFCIKEILKYPSDKIVFETLSGKLIVTQSEGLLRLNLPSRKPVPSTLPKFIEQALNIQPKEILKSRDLFLVYNSQKEIEDIIINRQEFDKIDLSPGGVIVTAEGKTHDFVSRYFTPRATILEDPVTGSAHCSLTPFWSHRLKRKNLIAKQLSERSGILYCEDKKDRVIVSGKALLYSQGEAQLPPDHI
tara:strand:- start:426 stop:1226 length:801 start_codon:yes stop_codon:yes gene_type:complete